MTDDLPLHDIKFFPIYASIIVAFMAKGSMPSKKSDLTDRRNILIDLLIDLSFDSLASFSKESTGLDVDEKKKYLFFLN